MCSIKLFKMVDTNAGAIRTVIVEIKYISSNNVAIHTENPKLETSLDCTRSRNVDLTLEVLTFSSHGPFVHRTQGQLEQMTCCKRYLVNYFNCFHFDSC